MYGEYTIGNLVVPKTYKKLVLKNGIVNTVYITVQKNKVNINPKKLTKKHEQFMKCFGKDLILLLKISLNIWKA